MKDRLRNWLGVKEPKDWSKNIDELWKRVSDKLDETNSLMERFSEVKCGNCGKLVMTYPMGGGYHRLFDGTILCSDCGREHSKPAPTEPVREET